MPEKIVINKSGVNTAAIKSIQTDSGEDIEMRQIKYLNNIVEQDHQAIKRVVRPMLGFKTFRCAGALIADIETMHMIRKGQLDAPEAKPRPRPATSVRWLFEQRRTQRFAELGIHTATERIFWSQISH